MDFVARLFWLMDELVGYVLDQARVIAASPVMAMAAVLLLAASIAAVLQRSYSRRIAILTESIRLRDDLLTELQERLHASRIDELQTRVANLNPHAVRRRVTSQQQALLAEYASVPEGRQFTIEIIHDMAGADCSAYANDFRTVFNQIDGWSASRSAVLGPGWVARCGLGVHVRDRATLTTAETIVINAFATAGIDYDLVQISALEADVGLLVTTIPANRLCVTESESITRDKASLRLCGAE
jgi:hypothetical protein